MIKDRPGHWGYNLDDEGRLLDPEDGMIMTQNLPKTIEKLWFIVNNEKWGLGGDLFIREIE